MPEAAAALAHLIEAVADGRAPDLSELDSSRLDEGVRARVAALQDIWEIGQYLAALATRSTFSSANRTEGNAYAPPRPPIAVPGVWGTLSLREHVGHGQFGDVYRAWDPALDREVALKLLRREPRDADQSTVVREGRLMARVRHPNVVAIHGAQRIDGRTGLWMEFIHGRTLEAELAETGPMAADAIVGVAIELCAALEAVHAAGLVHRDVKAQNVMRERTGRIVLGDFGTGREPGEGEDGPAVIAGTPTYLAPEIFEHQPATPRSDIYALGTLLFHLATRDYPVKGRTIAELRMAHQARKVTSLGAVRADLPAALVAAIDRALDLDPARRFGQASDFALALEAARKAPVFRRRRAVTGVALGLTTLVAALLVGGFWRAPDAPAASLADQRLVLVTAVVNPTGEPVLGGTIEYVLERELSRSTAVTVVPRPRVMDVLRLMRMPADTPLDPAIGREVALRDGGIAALVTGRVEHVGGMYGMNVDVVDPATGATLASISEPPVPVDELLKAVGRAAIGVRQRLREGLQSMEANRLELARVTTPSLAALQLYSKADRILDGQGGGLVNPGLGEQLLRQAIAEDPGFAAAHALLAEQIRIQPNARLTEALDHISQAIKHSNGVSQVERLRIEESFAAVRAQMTEDQVERRRWLEIGIEKDEAILRLRPNDYSSLVKATSRYQTLGRPQLGHASRLSDLRPDGWEWAARASFAALWSGDAETARRYAQRGAALLFPVGPIGPPGSGPAQAASWLRLFAVYEAWLRNDVHAASLAADRVAAGFDRLPQQTRSEMAAALSGAYLMLGRLARAEAFASRIEDPARRKFHYLAVAREWGDADRLWAVVSREYPRLEGAPGTAMVEAGRIAAAKAAVTREKRWGDLYRGFVTSQVALVEHRPDEAVRGLESYLAAFLGGDGHYVATKLARAMVLKGDLRSAIALLESHSKQRVALVRPGTQSASGWLPLREQLATLYRQQGRIRDAEPVEAELRVLLSLADEDHPIRRRLLASTSAVGRAATSEPSPPPLTPTRPTAAAP